MSYNLGVSEKIPLFEVGILSMIIIVGIVSLILYAKSGGKK